MAKQLVSDKDIIELSQWISPHHMVKIAVRYLDVPLHLIDAYRLEAHMDSLLFNFRIFEHWCNRHGGPKPKEELLRLLKQASREEGLIDMSRFSFLMDLPESAATGKQKETL